MNRFKSALASDFDGTLYFYQEEEKMKPADVRAIEAFQEAGGLFGICTGRSLQGILLFAQNISFDFYIVVSGALILDKSLKPIARHCVDRQLLSEVYERYKAQVETVVQADDTFSLNEVIPAITQITSLDDIKGDDIYGLSLAARSTQEARDISREIVRLYGDRLAAFQNNTHIDVVPAGCSKGNAIKVVKNYFGIDRIGGIGDSYNDIPMIESADVGFTFPYAPADVRERADHIVGSVAEALQIISSQRRG